MLRYFQCNCKPDSYWLDTRAYTTEMLADFAAHGEKRDILKFGMAFYKKNLVVCKDIPRRPAKNTAASSKSPKIKRKGKQ